MTKKNASELSFNLEKGMDVNLDFEGNYFTRKSNSFSIKPKQFFAISNLSK